MVVHCKKNQAARVASEHFPNTNRYWPEKEFAWHLGTDPFECRSAHESSVRMTIATE
jgi:hypothetical protein